MNVYLSGCLSIVLFQVRQIKLWLDVPSYQQKQRTCQQACTDSPFPFWGNPTHTMCPESWRADWIGLWLLLRCCILSREIRKSTMSILKYDSGVTLWIKCQWQWLSNMIWLMLQNYFPRCLYKKFLYSAHSCISSKNRVTVHYDSSTSFFLISSFIICSFHCFTLTVHAAEENNGAQKHSPTNTV